MKPENKNIDQIIARKLSNFEAVPPADMWARIQKKRERRSALLLLKYAALILLFMGSGSVLWYLSKVSVDDTVPVMSELTSQVDETVVIVNEIEPNEAYLTEPNPETTSKSRVSHQNKRTPNSQLTRLEEISQVDKTHVSLENNEAINSYSTTDQDVIEALASNDIEKSKAVLILPEPQDLNGISPLDQKSDNNPWNLGLAYGMMPTTEFNSEMGSKGIASSNFSFDNFQGELAFETVFFDQIESTIFKPPVSVGIVFALPLSPRFNFESGFQYTLLSHESRTIVSNARRSVYKTNLHYIGLPIGIQFCLVKNKFIRLYISQSALLEKGIRADYAADRYEKTKLLGTDYSTSSIRGIQLSSVSALGVEMPVFKFISVYGQAGAQYFFLNKTQPFNLRSEQTLWPSFQTGLRVTIDR